MATNFTNTFTGKGTSVLLPKRDTSAQEGMSQMITKANELKDQAYKQNEAEYLKNSQIDPVFVLSDSARKYQMSLIENFNKKWGKRAQETNYNLSTQDKQDMLTDKNLIISEAHNQLATMDRFQQHRDLVQKNPGKFDTTAFAEATNNYMKTGRYDQTMPAWQPIDFGAFIQEESKKVTGKWDELSIRDQLGQIQQESYNIPAQEQGKFIISQLGKNPQADTDFWNRWNSADKEKYFKLAESNGDNKTSPEEEKNAIALWAKDEFGAQSRIRQLTVPKGQSKTSTSIEPSDVGGSQIKLSPGKQVPNQRKTYGDREYSQTQSFVFGNNPTIYGIPTRNGKSLNPNWTEEDIAKGSINGRLVLYDPTKKVFLVESVVTSESADQKSRTLLEIPEENILDYGNIPIEYIGNKMTIAEYKKFMEGETPAKEKTTEGNKWDKYKVK